MRKSRAEALKRQRKDKFAGFFGLSSKPVSLPKPETKPAEAKPVAKISAPKEEEDEPLQFTEDGTVIARRAKKPEPAGPVAVASVEPADLEALAEERDESRRASRKAALIVSAILHVFVLLGMAFVVLPARMSEVQMTVGVPEKPIEDPEERQKQKLQNLSSPPTPKAKISLPKVVSHIPSPVAAPKVDVLSDETLGRAAMPGTGIGLGRGVMNFGGNPGGTAIGGLLVRSKKLGVVLDSSPSMTPFLPALRAEIRKNFRGSVFREIPGCTLRATNGRDTSDITTFYDPIAVMMGIKDLVEVQKVDAIYWFCDLQDPRTEEALNELEDMLRGSFPGRTVRLYLRSVGLKPDKRLGDIISRSGGEVEVGPVGG